MSSYGTDWKDFEKITGLYDGAVVRWRIFGSDKSWDWGLLGYERTGPGFQCIYLVTGYESYRVHYEPNGFNRAFNDCGLYRIQIKTLNGKLFGCGIPGAY